MTYRAVRLLAEVALIAAEDTRHTRKLLAHYDIHTPLTSYHEHNKFEKGPEILRILQEGKDVICVSDAGLPGIADPGAHLAELAIKENINVSVLPGANAALSALIISGLDTRRFVFLGFLPKTKKKRYELLEKVRSYEETLLFYEAPHHLLGTLADLEEVLGGKRKIALARELTKRYEEIRRGTLAELKAYYEENAIKGECVLVVEGNIAGVEGEQKTMLPPKEMALALLAEGMDKKEALRLVAKKHDIARREVYKLLLEEHMDT